MKYEKQEGREEQEKLCWYILVASKKYTKAPKKTTKAPKKTTRTPKKTAKVRIAIHNQRQ
jgi:hypothetical protein